MLSPWTVSIKPNPHLRGSFPFSQIKFRSLRRLPTGAVFDIDIIDKWIFMGMCWLAGWQHELWLDKIKQCQWFSTPISAETIFDFRIYHNKNFPANERQQQKNGSEMCDNEHAFNIIQHNARRHADIAGWDRQPSTNDVISHGKSFNTNIRQSIKRCQQRSVFARSDQDKRDDTEFYSLFSTISLTRTAPRVCVCVCTEWNVGCIRKLIAAFLSHPANDEEAKKKKLREHSFCVRIINGNVR